MMALIVAAQNVVVEFLPILERMARGAEANDRLAGIHVLADVIEFLFGKGHAANEKDDQVGGTKRFEAGDCFELWILGASQDDGFDGEVLLQVRGEWGKGFFAVVFVFAGKK